jgi:hypothetical protein
MHIVKELHLSVPLIAMYSDENGLYIASNEIALYHFDKEYKRLYKREMKNTKELHKFSKAISYSKNNNILLPDTEENFNKLLKFKEDVGPVQDSILLDSQIETSCYSANSKVLLIGDISGRCKIYRDNILITTLKPKPDYINTMAVSDDNRFLFYSAFNMSATIYDLKRSKVHDNFMGDAVIEQALFVDSNTLMLSLQNGAIVLYDCQKKEKIFQKNLISQWPAQLIKLNSEYVFICTRDIQTYFFNVKTQSVDFTYKLPYKGVSAIAKYEDLIYLSYVTGTVQVIDMLHNLDAFEIAIKVSNVAQVNKIATKNPFLKVHPEYKKFLHLSFDEDLQKSIKEIANSQMDIAKRAMDPHKEHARYAEFETFLKFAQEIVNFYQAISDRDLSLAYTLVLNVPILEKTQGYAQLEIIWNAIFKKAKTLLQEDAVINYRKAENLVRPFMKIANKKRLLGHLFNNIDIFSKADDAVKNQEFSKYFSYSKKYEFLEDTDLYKKMLSIGEAICDEMLQFENLVRYDQAIASAVKLKPFYMFTPQVKDMIVRIKIKKSFDQLVISKRYNEAFIMMEKHYFVQSLPKAIRLEAKLQKDIEYAHKECQQPKETLLYLKSYLALESCKELLASSVEQKYIAEMYKFSSHKAIHWAKVFQKFLAIYGETTELKKFAHQSAKEPILDQVIKIYTFVGKNKSKLPATILAAKK